EANHRGEILVGELERVLRAVEVIEAEREPERMRARDVEVLLVLSFDAGKPFISDDATQGKRSRFGAGHGPVSDSECSSTGGHSRDEAASRSLFECWPHGSLLMGTR